MAEFMVGLAVGLALTIAIYEGLMMPTIRGELAATRQRIFDLRADLHRKRVNHALEVAFPDDEKDEMIWPVNVKETVEVIKWGTTEDGKIAATVEKEDEVGTV